ncbi:LacI family transcriptional regulator [Cryobacterium zongtaii]|uniref:LacI family transcriptional regulator n=1 Tax=Cryobacterium zongtaii TaxID=1259217 RepID=A0A2S3ZFI9_9MICO|nr:LacI family DNA-binding transcriptional regulator [Cryobacterium zongtaii]POH65876.1 LacI family transcriptional regulator [Cryobacterium zongtaii]
MTHVDGDHVRRAEGGRRTTINDVARRANVSIATVSKVVNGRSGVGDDTRTRVEEAAENLGYLSVIERASSLRSAGEGTIEMLVEPGDVSNPYLSMLLGGALETAGILNTGLLMRPIASIADTPRADWAQSLVRAGRIGVIEVTSRYSAQRERALRAVGLPMILIDPIDQPRPSTPSIGATNWAGAYEATNHLLALGHRKIAYIGGPPGANCDVIRAHGWAAAMSDAGISVDLGAVPRGAYSYEHGCRSTEILLADKVPPTAIFAGSDISAMGVLEAARRAGLSVPVDLSVIGFDDTYLAHTATPPLTTVHQPIADIGRTAVSSIMRLAAGDSLAAKRVELATYLVERASTAPPSR